MAIEFIGWVGAILFSLCAVPQGYQAYRTRSVGDLSWGFLLMWFFGELLTLIYVVQGAESLQWPLITNYIINMIMVFYLLYAKHSFLPKR